MTTPSYSSPEEYRALNERMARSILEAEPVPYRDGGYVRRVVEQRGRHSGYTHLLPIAVVSQGGGRYLVSPVRERNWVLNLLAEPDCVVRSRDTSEEVSAVPVGDPDEVADVVLLYTSVMNAPWALAQFPFTPGAARDVVRALAGEVAVFRLESRT